MKRSTNVYQRKRFLVVEKQRKSHSNFRFVIFDDSNSISDANLFRKK